jgi:hypothetical protein
MGSALDVRDGGLLEGCAFSSARRDCFGRGTGTAAEVKKEDCQSGMVSAGDWNGQNYPTSLYREVGYI